MKNITTCLNIGLTAALALGMCIPCARAGQPGLHAKSFPLTVTPDTGTPAITMGIVAFGTLPPTDGSGNEEWPCYTGGSDADCSSIPAGALVVGIPTQDWSISACTAGGCGQLYWTFTSNRASGDVLVSETITQGSNTIYQSGTTDLGSGTAPFMSIIWDEIGLGPNACTNCVTPVAGTAKITATVTIGSVTVSREASIIMQK